MADDESTNSRKQLFRDDTSDGTDVLAAPLLGAPNVETNDSRVSLQHSPVLRPVQRSPSSNSSCDTSYDGSYLEQAVSPEKRVHVLHSPPQSVPAFNLQNYVLQNAGEIRDANASGASQNNLELASSGQIQHRGADNVQHGAAPEFDGELSQHELSLAVLDLPERNELEGEDSDAGHKSDLEEADQVSESENAEADQYLEMEQESAESEHFRQLHEDNGEEEEEEECEENSERCEPEGQYQGAYDRKLPGAQGYGLGNQGFAHSSQSMPLGNQGFALGHQNAPGSRNIPPSAQGFAHGSQSLPTTSQGFAQGSQNFSGGSGFAHSPQVYAGVQGFAHVPQAFAGAPFPTQDKHEPIRQWVLNVDPNPNPEDEQNPDDGDMVRQRLAMGMDREPTQGANQESDGNHQQPELHTFPTLDQEARGSAVGAGRNCPQSLPVSFQGQQAPPEVNYLSLPVQSDHAESEQTESYTEQTERVPARNHHFADSVPALESLDIHRRARHVSRAGSEGSQASGHSGGSRLSSGSRRDTQGGVSTPPIVSGNDVSRGSGHDSSDSYAKADSGSSKVPTQNKHSQELRQNPQGKGAMPKQTVPKTEASLQNGSTSSTSQRNDAKSQRQGLTSHSQQRSRSQAQGQPSSNARQPSQLSGIKTTKSLGPARANQSQLSKAKVTESQQRGQPTGSDPKASRKPNLASGQQKRSSPKGTKATKDGVRAGALTGNKDGRQGHSESSGSAQGGKSTRDVLTSGCSQGVHTSVESPPSLRKKMQQDGLDLSPIKSDERVAPPSGEQQRLLMQSPGVDAVKQVLQNMSHSQITAAQRRSLQNVTNADIRNMEESRQQLEAILHLQQTTSSDVTPPGGSTMSDMRTRAFADLRGDTFLGEGREGIKARTAAGYPHDSAAGSTHHFEEMLQFSAKYFAPPQDAENPVMCDVSALQMETKFLKAAFEKEQYKRKYCENRIQELERKLLEAQQQLAVATETDRKKDAMVVQLDRTLARVVENWKKGEAEREDKVKVMQREYEQVATQFSRQSQLIERLEADLRDSVEKLSVERMTSQREQAEKQQQLQQKEEERHLAVKELAQERKGREGAEQEVRGLSVRLERQAEQFTELKSAYDMESESWEEKEKEYLEKIDAITTNHMTSIEEEKERNSQLEKKLAETQKVLNSTQKHVKELEIELDTVVRDRESLKIQIGLLEAKMESQQRKLEAAYNAELEKQLSVKMEEAHRDMCASEARLQERHRAQVKDISQRHQHDLEEHLSKFRADLQDREERYGKQEDCLHELLNNLKAEIAELKKMNSSYETQRAELTNRLQDLMTSHCSQALRLLQTGSTPNDVNAVFGSLYGSTPVKPSNPNSGVTMPTTTTVTYSNNHAPVVTTATAYSNGSPGRRSAPAGDDVNARGIMTSQGHQHVPQRLQQAGSPGDQNGRVPDSLATDHDVSMFSSLSETQNDENSILSEIPAVGPSTMARDQQLLNIQSLATVSQGQFTSTLFGDRLGSEFSTVVSKQQSAPHPGVAMTSHLPSNISIHSNRGNMEPSREGNMELHFPGEKAPPKELISLKPVNYGDEEGHPGEGRTQISLSFVNKPNTALISDVSQSLHATSLRLQDGASQLTSLRNPSENPRALFQNLSAQNYEGVELIRAQIEAQRRQVETLENLTQCPEEQSSHCASTIMLHPPVQLDTSGLSAPPLPESRDVTSSREHSSSGSGSQGQRSGTEQRVTWQLGHDASFASVGNRMAFHKEEVHRQHQSGGDRSVEFDYSGIAHKFDSHESRQEELQKYIKMLLEKSPGCSVHEADDAHTSPGSDRPTPRPQPDQSPTGQVAGLQERVGEMLQDMYGHGARADAPQQGSLDARSYLRETQQNRYEPAEQPSSNQASPSSPQPEGQGHGSPRKGSSKARRNLEATYQVQNGARKQVTQTSQGGKQKQTNLVTPKQRAHGSKAPAQQKKNAPSGKKGPPVWK